MNFVYRFRTSNNVRCATLWVLVVALLIINLLVFGFGWASAPSPLPETIQRYNNLEFRGAFATDAELLSWYQRFSGGISGAFGWWWEWLRFFAWTGWFLLLVTSVIYTPLAFRDELERAKETIEALREERGGAPSESQTAPAATSPTGDQMTLGRFLKLDLFIEFLTEIGRTLLRRMWRGGV